MRLAVWATLVGATATTFWGVFMVLFGSGQTMETVLFAFPLAALVGAASSLRSELAGSGARAWTNYALDILIVVVPVGVMHALAMAGVRATHGLRYSLDLSSAQVTGFIVVVWCVFGIGAAVGIKLVNGTPRMPEVVFSRIATAGKTVLVASALFGVVELNFGDGSTVHSDTRHVLVIAAVLLSGVLALALPGRPADQPPDAEGAHGSEASQASLT